MNATPNCPPLTAPLKTHGGKAYLASRLVQMMPQHLHYVEPYFGGGSVLLHKDPNGVSEVVNDLNRDLMKFWRVLQSPTLFQSFQRQVEATPFSEQEWHDAVEVLKAPAIPDPNAEEHVGRAVAFFVRCRQSLAGRQQDFAPLSRTRVRRAMNEQASAWLGAIEGLPAVHERLKRVVVLSHKAVDVIRQQDGKDTLCYCDPPYVHSTRSSSDDYDHEMTDADHSELLDTLGGVQGRFMLSGYDCDLYRAAEQKYGWHRTEFDMANNAASGTTKRRMVEVVWHNFTAPTWKPVPMKSGSSRLIHPSPGTSGTRVLLTTPSAGFEEQPGIDRTPSPARLRSPKFTEAGARVHKATC